MELRERPRAGTWNDPKIPMQRKKEKSEDKPEWVELLGEKTDGRNGQAK